MTAHPKEDPVTGELHFFGSSPFPPYLTYHVADAEGRARPQCRDPGRDRRAQARLRHHPPPRRLPRGQCHLRPRRALRHPVRLERRQQPPASGSCPAARTARRSAGSPSSRGTAARRQRLRGRSGPHRPGGPDGGPRRLAALLELVGRRTRARHRAQRPLLHPRWVIDLAAGTVDEQIIDDLPWSSPPSTTTYLGAEHRYQYAMSFPDDEGFGGYGMVKYDRATGARRIHQVGDARLPSEAVFVPADGATRRGRRLPAHRRLRPQAGRLQPARPGRRRPHRIATVHLPRRVTGGHPRLLDPGLLTARLTDRLSPSARLTSGFSAPVSLPAPAAIGARCGPGGCGCCRPCPGCGAGP